MNLKNWYAARGRSFVRRRATRLLGRFSMSTTNIPNRLNYFIAKLVELECAPTCPTPGSMVKRYPQFFRHLQSNGAEIAVHGYYHIDLSTLPLAEARQQIIRAADIFEQFGIKAYGFRCPYMGHTNQLLAALPKGLFDYSSNKAIGWEVSPDEKADIERVTFDTLQRFYRPEFAQAAVCVPRSSDGLIEIPVCVPDDLELHDGLHLDQEGMTEAWSQILVQIHKRGELFTLLFHPELIAYCMESLVMVLHNARRLKPEVWTARLCDISNWWREKSAFTVSVSRVPEGLHLVFECSERATVLVRGLDIGELGQAWDGTYCQLKTRTLDIPSEPLPFVGVASSAPRVVSFLREQGYILDTTETAQRCAVYLDDDILARLKNEVELVNHIEGLEGPLIRYWRWPGGAKSALCITGDLDALSLLDYASRLFEH